MITIKFLKPFYTKLMSDSKLRLVFAYQYFSIIKDDEVYLFIPIEGKEIMIDLMTLQIVNKDEIFVFQRGNRYIRMPLHQLMSVSDLHKHLRPIIEEYVDSGEEDTVAYESGEDVQVLVNELEKQNLLRAIDDALANRDEDAFYELASRL